MKTAIIIAVTKFQVYMNMTQSGFFQGQARFYWFKLDLVRGMFVRNFWLRPPRKEDSLQKIARKYVTRHQDDARKREGNPDKKATWTILFGCPRSQVVVGVCSPWSAAGGGSWNSWCVIAKHLGWAQVEKPRIMESTSPPAHSST